MRESIAKHVNAESVRLSPYYGGFFLWGLGTGAQQLARPLFAHSLGASVFLIVLVTASNAFAQLLSAPLTGFLADRLGRKPLVLLGNGIRGVTTVLQFFSGSYWEFFILEFIGAFGVAMWTTSSSVVMADISKPENRGRLLALRQMSSRVGMIAGPILGGVIAEAFSLRAVFLFNGASKVFIHILVYFLAKETAPENVREASKQTTQKADFSFFKTRAFAALLITSFALNMMGGAGAFGALFPVQAEEQAGLSAAQVGNMLSLAGLFGLTLSYPNGMVVDRFGRKTTLLPGLLILAASAYLLSQISTMHEVLVMIFVFSVGSTMSMGASEAFALDLAPDDRRGAFLGVWTLFRNAGAVGAPLIIGAIADRFGIAPGYYFVGAFLVVSALFMALFGPETSARRRPVQVAAAYAGLAEAAITPDAKAVSKSGPVP
jgi:MFS family permease